MYENDVIIDVLEFPSPVGEVVSYMRKRGYYERYTKNLFPSPVGEVVSYIGRWFVDGVDASTVSVPYRGSSFLYVAGHHGCRVTLGFRPLSGK